MHILYTSLIHTRVNVYESQFFILHTVTSWAHKLLPPPNGAVSLDDASISNEIKLIPRLTPLDVAPKSAEGFPVFSCLISTLLDDEEEGNYANRVFWVEYPPAVINQAARVWTRFMDCASLRLDAIKEYRYTSGANNAKFMASLQRVVCNRSLLNIKWCGTVVLHF
jgi:hypothetical protein